MHRFCSRPRSFQTRKVCVVRSWGLKEKEVRSSSALTQPPSATRLTSCANSLLSVWSFLTFSKNLTRKENPLQVGGHPQEINVPVVIRKKYWTKLCQHGAPHFLQYIPFARIRPVSRPSMLALLMTLPHCRRFACSLKNKTLRSCFQNHPR